MNVWNRKATNRSMLLFNHTVLLLVLGDAFRTGGRTGGTPCNLSKTSIEGQREATATHVHNLVNPMRESGATVSVLLIINRCPRETAHFQNDVQRTLLSWYDEMKVDSVESKLANSPHIEYGWRIAHAYARRFMRANGKYDFLLQVRHDVALERPIDQWPGDLSRLSFERACFDCGGSCTCNGYEDLQYHSLNRKCEICHADHILWVPNKYIDTVQRAIILRGAAGHDLLSNILVHEPKALPIKDVGFLFPQECEMFPIDINCGEIGAYRPLRINRETGNLPPKASDSESWKKWEEYYGVRVHKTTENKIRWQNQVNKLRLTPEATLTPGNVVKRLVDNLSYNRIRHKRRVNFSTAVP